MNAKYLKMNTEQEHAHDELLVRIAIHAEEMRFHKNQQWRTLYYAILFLAATALAFQQPVQLGAFYFYAKLFGYAIVCFITAASIIHLLSTKYDIELNRAAAESLHHELDLLTGVFSKLARRHRPRYRKVVQTAPFLIRWLPKALIDRQSQGRLFNWIFYALFISIIVATGIAVFILILFDT